MQTFGFLLVVGVPVTIATLAFVFKDTILGCLPF
jgi:hypothetical protein